MPRRHLPRYPVYSRGERAADVCVHAAGVAVGLGGFAAILTSISQTTIGAGAALLVYGAAMLAMLACSAAYNLTRPSFAKELLRRLDRGVIFVMIAGTYTAFMGIALPGWRGTLMLAFVWCGALAGAIVELVFPRRYERLLIGLCLLLGWSFLFVFDAVVAALPRAALLLLAGGGLLYTAGVAFHLWSRLPYHNAVWHALVLAAVICHYAAVIGWIAPAGSPVTDTSTPLGGYAGTVAGPYLGASSSGPRGGCEPMALQSLLPERHDAYLAERVKVDVDNVGLHPGMEPGMYV